MAAKTALEIIAEKRAEAEAQRLGIDIRAASGVEYVELEIEARGEIAECGKVIPFGASRHIVHPDDHVHLLKLSVAPSPAQYEATMSRLATMQAKDAKGEHTVRPSFEAAYNDLYGTAVPPLKSVRLASEVDAEKAARAKAAADAEAKAESDAAKARAKADAKLKAEIEAEQKAAKG